MKIEKNDNSIVLGGNELFSAIGAVALFFVCVGIRLIFSMLPQGQENADADLFGLCFIAVWTCLAAWMALYGINQARTELVLDEGGVEVRSLFRKRRINWNQIREYGLSYEGIANHEDNGYEFYFAEEPQQEKNEYSRKLEKQVLRFTVIGEEYEQVVQEVLPYCNRYARVKPFVPEDVEHLI